MSTQTKPERKAAFEKMAREAGEMMTTSFLAGCPPDAPEAAIREHARSTPTADELCLLLERSLRGLGEEYRVQAAIEALLKREGIGHVREFTLSPKDRIDFLVGAIGVEVKTGGGISAVIRQLHRYAEFGTVSELILVTARTTLARVPRELNGKRVHVAVLLAGIV